MTVTNRQFSSNGQALWHKATSGGAQSINHGGHIRVGNQADWLVLDNNHPSLVALDEKYLLDALIFSNRGHRPIKDVF